MRIKTKLGLRSQFVKIPFVYSIEDSIYDVDMLICLFTKNAFENEIELSSIVEEFTGDNDNDQYRLFETTFKNIFKDDGVNSFSDYKKAYKRSVDIINQSSMIYDIRKEISCWWIEDIGRYEIKINSNKNYVSTSDLGNFIESHINDFIEDNKHLSKSPKFKNVMIHIAESELENYAVNAEINTDFDSFYIDNEKYNNKKVLDRVINEFAQETRNEFIKLFGDNHLDNLYSIDVIENQYEIFNASKVKNVITSFDNNLKISNEIIYFDGDNIGKYLILKYKGILMLGTDKITPNELLNQVNWEFDFKMDNKLFEFLLQSISSIEEFRLVERFYEMNGLSNKIVNELILTKMDLLIESEINMISDVQYINLINKNEFSRKIDILNRYDLLLKHANHLITEEEYCSSFLYEVSMNNNKKLTKEHNELVAKYTKDKNSIVDQIREFELNAINLRSRLNSLQEKYGDVVSDKKLHSEEMEMRSYLNRIVHWEEEDKSKGKVAKRYPELGDWLRVKNSNYSYDLITNDLLLKLKEREIQFSKKIDKYSEHIELRLKEI